MQLDMQLTVLDQNDSDILLMTCNTISIAKFNVSNFQYLLCQMGLLSKHKQEDDPVMVEGKLPVDLADDATTMEKLALKLQSKI